MWSGGISKRNPVRPAGKWAQGLTCQTAKTPACHIQFVRASYFIHFPFGQVNKKNLDSNNLFRLIHLFHLQDSSHRNRPLFC